MKYVVAGMSLGLWFGAAWGLALQHLTLGVVLGLALGIPGGLVFSGFSPAMPRNRAAGEVRTAMTRNGGNMADPGSVSYLFTRKGVVVLEKNGRTEDEILEVVLEAGAEEINDLGDSFEIVSEASDLIPVRTALVEAGIDYDSADPDFRASVEVPVDAEGARKVFKLVDALEDCDDVQNVYTNVDVSDEVLAELDA